MTSVTFLQPTDPLFEEIGANFLRTYISEFGTDHMYSADFFNEMPPPSSDPNYLQSCSKSLYKSLTAVDPEAVWITQGWMFYSDPDIWQPAQARAFLRAVPLARCTLADLVVGSNKCQSDTEAINDFRGMENSWTVPTHLLQSEGVANDLSDTIASDFPLELERKLDVFEYVATNWAVHTYDNSCSYNRYY
ncbi:Alpha-N-acetylglucosaminidase [Araneus ventricosus]|uniref:Alpha-N-acetylglucosaminidase n=1 Tax=Araneus ventricosus TaxID=182803 RepID=A0A4Y2AT75_ARAVE|nr:Alpha-N-acetylglucosaminidase [Araneus ventricosus]